MVTIPLLVDVPELAVEKWPAPDLTEKATVAPETARFFASTTVAVIVVVFDPSALIVAADEDRMIEAAGPAVVAVLVPELPDALGEVLLASPPPALQACKPKTDASNATTTMNLPISMFARFGRPWRIPACFCCLPADAGHRPQLDSLDFNHDGRIGVAARCAVTRRIRIGTGNRLQVEESGPGCGSTGSRDGDGMPAAIGPVGVGYGER